MIFYVYITFRCKIVYIFPKIMPEGSYCLLHKLCVKRGSMRNGRKMARAKMGAGPPTPLGGTIGVL